MVRRILWPAWPPTGAAAPRRPSARRDRWHWRSCKLGRVVAPRFDKAAAYEVVRQHIMYRLRKGIDACNAGASGVADWEIGYALHAGSLKHRRLGQRQIDVCARQQALPAIRHMRRRHAGRHQQPEGPRRGVWRDYISPPPITALTASETILAQLTVPLVQGMVREAYGVDPNGGAATADGVVEVAEGWAFTTAILPQIAMCNASIAQLIRTNMALSLDGANGAHVASGSAS